MRFSRSAPAAGIASVPAGVPVDVPVGGPSAFGAGVVIGAGVIGVAMGGSGEGSGIASATGSSLASKPGVRGADGGSALSRRAAASAFFARREATLPALSAHGSRSCSKNVHL